MAELKYLGLHCSETRPKFNLTGKILESWHKGPRDIKENGVTTGVRYMGKTYSSRDLLPVEFLNGRSIKELVGRGWDRCGYADLFLRNGDIENITPYNDDDIVDPWEVTFGIAGINAFTRHVCLVGGLNNKGERGIFKFHDIFTDAQFTTLIGYVKQFLKDHENTQVVAHYQFSKKTCPGFGVYNLLKDADIDPARIYTKA